VVAVHLVTSPLLTTKHIIAPLLLVKAAKRRSEAEGSLDAGVSVQHDLKGDKGYLRLACADKGLFNLGP
jgi:hypothetical protein